MLSTTNNPITGIKRRTFRFSIILALVLYAVHLFLLTSRLESRKQEVVIDVLQADEKLSNELYQVLHGLEDDFDFFEKEIPLVSRTKKENSDFESLLNFLSTHPQYFKIRLVLDNGTELFKLIQHPGMPGKFDRTEKLFNLSAQRFFQELKSSTHEEFYFSSMEANVVNGFIQKPITPTIRVAKRVLTRDNKEALLVVNIDGLNILRLFEKSSSQKFFIDSHGQYVASFPILPIEEYTIRKKKVGVDISKLLEATPATHGSFNLKDEVVVFTKIVLPQSGEKWFLVSRIPEERLQESIRNERLTWIFWELMVFVLCITWYWKSEKRKFHEQVVQVLLKERGEFIQDVSHQLKTPLTIVQNYFSQDEDIITHSSEIKSELSHLIRVIDDLLLLSHMESFKQVTLRRENLVEIVQEAIAMVATKAKAKGVRVKLTIAENLIDSLDTIERHVLPELIKSAFFNLLDNAVEYSPVKSDVEVVVTKSEQRISLSFNDCGPGVPEKFVPLMFNRFTRADDSRKGSGLGLAIAKKIIELHRGDLRYYREEGITRFTVDL